MTHFRKVSWGIVTSSLPDVLTQEAKDKYLPAVREVEEMLSVKKDVWDEIEASQALGISLPRLHSLLDEHVFTVAHPRPEGCTFRSSDLVLLEFWLRSEPNPKVVRMPRR